MKHFSKNIKIGYNIKEKNIIKYLNVTNTIFVIFLNSDPQSPIIYNQKSMKHFSKNIKIGYNIKEKNILKYLNVKNTIFVIFLNL